MPLLQEGNGKASPDALTADYLSGEGGGGGGVEAVMDKPLELCFPLAPLNGRVGESAHLSCPALELQGGWG